MEDLKYGYLEGVNQPMHDTCVFDPSRNLFTELEPCQCGGTLLWPTLSCTTAGIECQDCKIRISSREVGITEAALTWNAQMRTYQNKGPLKGPVSINQVTTAGIRQWFRRVLALVRFW